MNSDIKAHEFDECLVITETEEVGQVVGVVFGRINSRKLALPIEIAVDATRNARKLGDAVVI